MAVWIDNLNNKVIESHARKFKEYVLHVAHIGQHRRDKNRLSGPFSGKWMRPKWNLLTQVIKLRSKGVRDKSEVFNTWAVFCSAFIELASANIKQ